MDHVYFPFYELYSDVVGTISACMPFSLGDVLYFLLGLLMLRYITRTIRALLQKNKSLFSIRVYNGIKVLNLAIVMYYLCWGWVYYAPDLENLYDTDAITNQELKALSARYLEECIKIRSQLAEDEHGLFRSQSSDKEWAASINQDYKHLPHDIKRVECGNSHSLKKSLYSPILVYLGIGGYFNPFSRECQYITKVSEVKKPFIMAHEMSHQWAYGKENEANFMAYLLGRNSENLALRYSTTFSTLRRMLYAIQDKDSIFVDQMQSHYSLGMQRDMHADSLLQQKYTSPYEGAFSELNHFFLKMNQQEGLSSYSRYIRLVVGYERKLK